MGFPAQRTVDYVPMLRRLVEVGAMVRDRMARLLLAFLPKV